MRIHSKLVPGLFLAVALPVHAALNIFSCEPEWQSLASQLAPSAKTFSATTALQDPHQIQARPSLIAQMRKADLAICSGAELEVGWLPMLQMKSANPKVQSTRKGLFYAADHVETIDKLDSVSPMMGDVHPGGNPHLHLDPYRLQQLSHDLGERMASIDKPMAQQYRRNAQAFAELWQRKIGEWENRAKGLKGKNVVAYHSSFDYLFRWLGINKIGDLEPKPGLPPSASHLAYLLAMSRDQKVDAVVYASYQDSEGAQWLGEKIGVPVVELPFSVGGNAESTDLVSLYDNLINKLIAATAAK
ncbi:MAG: metal ABC transporter solute-binding protein, Zn/Mn family [Endozoicomonas sp.]